MATKIYKSYNYIILDDGTGVLKEIPTKDCTYDLRGTDYTIIDTIKGFETLAISFSDITNESGVPYSSQSIFNTFLRENTGSEPGGSATTTAVNTISAANSTTALLTSSATFTGVWEDVTSYATVASAVLGSISTDGVLYFDVSTDAGSTFTSIPNIVGDANFSLPRILNVVETHVRIRYVNGTTAQTGTFNIQTKYSNGQELGLLGSVDGIVNGETPTQVVRAVNTGVKPSGVYDNAKHTGNDANNTTTTPLGSGATFTGSWTNVESFHGVVVSLEGSIPGESGRLHLEFSHDGVTNAEGLGTSVYVNDLTNTTPRTVGVVSDYFRVRYVNGSVAQTSLSIQTILSIDRYDLTATSNQLLEDNEDVRLVRTVSDLNTERNTGLLRHQVALRKYGTNEAVGNSLETVWSYSANWIPNQVINQKLRIKAGGNAADDTAGAGAQTVQVKFLDENNLEITETIVTAGASASAVTTANCFRLQSAKTIDVGTYHGANTGDIVFELTGGNIMGNISSGSGSTEQCILTVPSNKTIYITQILVSVGQNNSADIKLFAANNSTDLSIPFGSKRLDWTLEDYQSTNVFNINTHLKYESNTDIWVEAERITGSGSARVSVDLNYYTVDNQN